MGKIIGEGITFDDVLLVPAYSEVIPTSLRPSVIGTPEIRYFAIRSFASSSVCSGERKKGSH